MEFWVDADDARRNFQAFAENPQWLSLKDRTEQDGPLCEKNDVTYMKIALFFLINN